MQAPRRADPEARAHEEPEMARARVDQESFQDVLVSAQVRPAQPAGLVEMRVRAFEEFAACTQ